MKKALVLLYFLIILCLITALIYFGFFVKSNNQVNLDKVNNGPIEENRLNEEENSSLDLVEGEVSGENNAGGGGAGGSSGEAGSSIGEEVNNLPSDISSRECGFYFNQYKVCAGKCPLGNCVSEGESCYCKL